MKESNKMAQQEAMGLLEFQKRFPTEEAYRTHLYRMRWSKWFICPKCSAIGEPFQIKSRNLYQCKNCNHQKSVTAGIVMDKTRVPLQKWFWAMFLMSHDKRGCSAAQIQRELDLAYGTAWLMCHKIRSAMGERDTQYVLDGHIEVDDVFFGGASEGGKHGRGTGKTVVLVGVSLDKKRRPLFAKMKVAPNVRRETLEAFAKENFASGSFLSSDVFPAYRAIGDFKHISEQQNVDHLKWLHIIISNAKSFILGTYHGLGTLHLQSYLDEFCYRINHRKFSRQYFERTLLSCICAPILTYHELTA